VTERWLADVSRFVLEDLEKAVRAGRLLCPFDQSALNHAGFSDSAGSLACLVGLPQEAVLAATQSVLADRALRPSSDIELVWTGPEGTGSASRDTAVLLAQLFASARESVFIAGYSFDHGEDLLRPLAEVIEAHGVTARVVLNIERMASGATDADDHARENAAAFLKENWPFNTAPPELLYDPRTVAAGSTASMHAKCVVIDGQVTLITSANFTDRGQRRNIECGVLMRDANLSSRMLRQWEGLIGQGFLKVIARST
jgi:phosphatidylserine/phosphatidylglycerophosphate/cardiolipin synthase-like enzyme